MSHRRTFADAVSRTARTIAGTILIAAVSVSHAAQAQNRFEQQNRYDPYARRYNPYERLTFSEAGALRAVPDRIESRNHLGRNDETAEFVGTGALLGTIVGALTGGGKGAAIGAAAGAAGVLTRGRFVRIPAGTLLTFRLERGLTIGVHDEGFTRDRLHYHRD